MVGARWHLLDLLALACVGLVPSPAIGAPDKVDPKKLVERYFAAAPADRPRILESLAPFDAVATEAIEAWRKSLLSIATRGHRVSAKSKATLYEKPDRGLYLLAGRKGADALLVALHGGGLGAGDAGQAASDFGGAASSLGMRLAAPEVLEKSEHGWTDPVETEKFVLDLIEALVRTEKLDRNRVLLTGHSMGGYGTWTIGAVHADLFAGLAAFAGAPTCTRTGPATGPMRASRGACVHDLEVSSGQPAGTTNRTFLARLSSRRCARVRSGFERDPDSLLGA